MYFLLCILLQLLLPNRCFAQIQKTYVIDGHLKLTWKEAMDKCRQGGMTLVSIDSKEEEIMLKKLIEPSQNFDGAKIAEMDYWTDGIMGDDGKWIWASTGRPLMYTNWAPGSPSDSTRGERCMKLWGHHHLQWDDYLCSARIHYICQRVFLSPNLFAFQGSNVGPPVRQNLFVPQSQGIAFPGRQGEIVFPAGGNQFGPQFQDGNILNSNQFVVPITKKKKIFADLPFEEGHILDPDDFTTTTKKKKFFADLPFEEGHILDPDDFKPKNGSVVKIQKPQLPKTPDSYKIIMHTLKFIVFPKEMLRWLLAKEFCEAKKMDLASLADEQELCKLTTFMKNLDISAPCYWVQEWEGKAWNKRCNRDRTRTRTDTISLVEDLKQSPGREDRRCPLLNPSKDEIVTGVCWLRCSVICEFVDFD